MISTSRQPYKVLHFLDDVLEGLAPSKGALSIRNVHPMTYKKRSVLPFYCPSFVEVKDVQKEGEELPRSIVHDWITVGTKSSYKLGFEDEDKFNWREFDDQYTDLLDLEFVITRRGVSLRKTKKSRLVQSRSIRPSLLESPPTILSTVPLSISVEEVVQMYQRALEQLRILHEVQDRCSIEFREVTGVCREAFGFEPTHYYTFDELSIGKPYDIQVGTVDETRS